MTHVFFINIQNMISYNQISGNNPTRVEALSDGIFAVALTLLVLDIRVPINIGIHSEKDLSVVFYSLMPKFLSYFLSFMTLGIIWTAQTTQFIYIEKSDRNLNWISLFFLLFVSVLPFTTAFLSEYINFKLSIFLYWLNLSLLGLLLYVHWHYAHRTNLLSLKIADKDVINQAMVKRIFTSQILYTIGAALCFINTYMSIGFIILIQINYAFGLVDFKTKDKILIVKEKIETTEENLAENSVDNLKESSEKINEN